MRAFHSPIEMPRNIRSTQALQNGTATLHHHASSKPAMSPPPPAVLTQDEQKRLAAHRAVELIESNMVVGLGTGSTADHALLRLAELLRLGLLSNIVGVPTSKQTEARAIELGIPLTDLDAYPVLDISIDGADEVDPALNLVKGRGGSLLREKMVEAASRRFVVIVDESKMIPRLGLNVPVEVVPFCCNYTLGQLRNLFSEEPGFNAKLRIGKNGEPFVTDNSNYIVDLYFENGIGDDLDAISDEILRLTGVIEHGMFLGLATSVIVAKKDGGVTVINK